MKMKMKFIHKISIIGGASAVAISGFSDVGVGLISDSAIPQEELAGIFVGSGNNCKKCEVQVYDCEFPDKIGPRDWCLQFDEDMCTDNRGVGFKWQANCNADAKPSVCSDGATEDNCVQGSGRCGTYLQGKGCVWSGNKCENPSDSVSCDGDNC